MDTNADVTIRRLEASEFAARAAEIVPFFHDIAATTSKETAHGITQDVLNLRRQVWVVERGSVIAVLLTSTSTQSSGDQWVTLEAISGRGRDGYEHLLGEVKKAAQDAGYKGVMAIARAGWTPLMKEHGFRETHRLFEVEF